MNRKHGGVRHRGPGTGLGRFAPLLAVVWAGLVLAWSAGYLSVIFSAPSGWLADYGYGPAFNRGALAAAAASHVLALAIPAAILCVAWWSGGPAIRWLGAGGKGPAAAVLRCLFGFGVVASFHHGLGLAGLLFVPLLAVCGVLAVAAGVLSAVRRKLWRSFHPESSARGNHALAVACAAVVAVLFMLARLPDTHADPRIYHFAAPEHYLKLHKMVSQPAHFSFHIPRAYEMDAMTPWALGGISAAKMVGFSAALAAVSLVFFLAVELGGSGWMASALFLGAGAIPSLVWQGKNDTLMSAYVVGGILCIMLALRERRRLPWLAAGAWLLGSAVGVKYNAGFVAGGAVLALFLLPWKGVHARAWPLLAVTGFLPAMEWFAESWIFLGNPFHPFLSGIFGQVSWGPFYREGMHQVVLAYSPPEVASNWDFLGGIWRVLGDPAQGSPAVFLLLPLALAASRSRRMAFIAVSGICAYAAWAATDRVARMAFAIVPLAAAFTASVPALSAVAPRKRAWFGVVVGILAVLFTLATAMLTVPLGGLMVLAGQKTSASYIDERFGSWNAVRLWVNAGIPAGSTVLFTGEEHRLWFRPRISSHHDVMEPVPWKMAKESRTPERMRIKMRQAGIGYILHNYLSSAYRRLVWWPGPDWDDRQLAVYSGFMGRYARPVYVSPRIDEDNGGFYVFGLRSRPLADPGPALMLPFTEGRWLLPYSLMRGGDLDQAWSTARKKFAPMKDVLQVRFVLATLAERRRNYGEALSLLEPAVRGGLVDNGSWAYYGALLARAGRMDESVRAFSRGARLQGDEGSRALLGRALRDRAGKRKSAGNAEGAKRDLEASGRLLGR